MDGMNELQGTCSIELIEAQVARTPDAEAVFGAEESLTYRELDRRAERLADRLRVRGIGLESRVGIFLPRTPDLLIALLAVLEVKVCSMCTASGRSSGTRHSWRLGTRPAG